MDWNGLEWHGKAMNQLDGMGLVTTPSDVIGLSVAFQGTVQNPVAVLPNKTTKNLVLA